MKTRIKHVLRGMTMVTYVFLSQRPTRRKTKTNGSFRALTTTLTFGPSLFVVLFLLLQISSSTAYHRKPCSRHHALDFSFPDCYLPPQNEDLLLSEASFVMSHDAATGYIAFGVSKTGLSSFYSKTQVGTLYQQLNNGARALDLRPWLFANGTVIFHHGAIRVPVTYNDAMEDVLQWARENPTELILLLTSHFGYENDNQYNDDQYAMVTALSNIYNSLGINYYSCEDVNGWTIGETQQAAAVGGNQDNGLILALDGKTYRGTSCAKENYVESKMVTCWPKTNRTSCKVSNEPWEELTSYVLASANNDATDDSSQLGPPASLDVHPLNEIQALWQVDLHAVAMGLSHFSSIIEDNHASNLNANMVDLIYDGAFQAVSLLAVDNVALHGNALLSVLRNTCGQSTLQDECGEKVPKPPMKRWRVKKIDVVAALLMAYTATLMALFFYRRPKLVSTLRARFSGNGNDALMDPSITEEPGASSR